MKKQFEMHTNNENPKIEVNPFASQSLKTEKNQESLTSKIDLSKIKQKYNSKNLELKKEDIELFEQGYESEDEEENT